MGRISELELAIKDLRSAAATINEVANTLAEMFSTTADEAPNTATPTPPQLTLEQVRAVLSNLSRKGFTADVRKLLKKHGAEKLSLIDPANYEALVAEAEKLTKPEEDTNGT